MRFLDRIDEKLKEQFLTNTLPTNLSSLEQARRFWKLVLFLSTNSERISKHFVRRFGLSTNGQKCQSNVPFSRDKRVSVLSAMDSRGFFALYATEGTFDRKVQSILLMPLVYWLFSCHHIALN